MPSQASLTEFSQHCLRFSNASLRRIPISRGVYPTAVSRDMSKYTNFKPAAPKRSEDFTTKEFAFDGGNIVHHAFTVKDKGFHLLVSLPNDGTPTAVVLVDELGFTNHEKHDDLIVPINGGDRQNLVCSELIFHLSKAAYALYDKGASFQECYDDVCKRLFTATTPRDMQKATSPAAIPADMFPKHQWSNACVAHMFISMLTTGTYSKEFYEKFKLIVDILKSHGVPLNEECVRAVECRDASDAVWGMGDKSHDILEELYTKFQAGERVDLLGYINGIIEERKACNYFGRAATAFLAAVAMTDSAEEFAKSAETFAFNFEVEEPPSPKRKHDQVDDEPVGRTLSVAVPDEPIGRTLSMAVPDTEDDEPFGRTLSMAVPDTVDDEPIGRTLSMALPRA